MPRERKRGWRDALGVAAAARLQTLEEAVVALAAREQALTAEVLVLRDDPDVRSRADETRLAIEQESELRRRLERDLLALHRRVEENAETLAQVRARLIATIEQVEWDVSDIRRALEAVVARLDHPGV